MKQALSLLLIILLLFSGFVSAADEAAGSGAIGRYEMLLAEGKSEIEALQSVLQEFGGDAQQVGAVVARAAADTGNPGAIAQAAVGILSRAGNTDSIGAAMDAILGQTGSTEQATQVAAQAMNAVNDEGAAAEAARQSITNSALANNVDPGALLGATAAIGGGATEPGDAGGDNPPTTPGPTAGPPAGGDGAGSAPGGGGGGGVGSLS